MKYKLSEIFEKPISGEWGNELEEGKYGAKVIRTTNFTNMGRLNLNDIVERDIDVEKYKNKLLKLGDIIIEKSGGSPNQPVGRVVIFEENTSEKYFCNNFTSILRPKNIVNAKYSLYLLKDLYNKKRVLKYQNKTTGIINLKLNDYLNNTEIMIPSIEEQIKISTILDKSQELIDKRKEQIEALDELVKSKFIEMFGDPFRNPKGWTVKQLKEIILLANNGLARRGNDKDGNIVLRLVELQDGFIDYSSPNRIRLTESEEKRYLLQDGDFLFARVNGNPDNVGRCSAYEDIGESVYHNDHIIRVRLDKNIVNNDYVSAILNSPYGKLQMKDKLKTSAGQYTINQNGISEIKITIPPIELQNKFADFVKQVDKLKFEMEKSLKELEDNFNSLMQKAFKGELFN